MPRCRLGSRRSRELAPGWQTKGADIHYQVLAPEGRDFLNCRFLKPKDFRMADIPHEEIDIDDPKAFYSLGVALAEYGPVVISIAARPAYSDGAVSQWLEYLCGEEGYAHGPIRECEFTGLKGVVCDAVQQADGVEMTMQLALVEDGGRLFQISLMAPTPIWSAVRDRLAVALQSFELQADKGQQAPLFVP